MPRELVNEETGETMTLADFIDQARRLERGIFRLDNTINDLKSSLKAAKEDHVKAVSALRAVVREIKVLSPKSKTKAVKA